MNNEGVCFGPYRVPVEEATEHFLFLGATGSGKTTLIKMLFRSAMELTRSRALFRNHEPVRTFMYDSKGEVISWIRGVLSSSDVTERVKNLDPFDQDGMAWDIARDAADPISAQQIASILIPEGEHSSDGDKFFLAASREVLTAAILLLNEKVPEKWSFRDLVLLALDNDRLADRLMSSSTFTIRRIAQSYLVKADAKTQANVMSSLSAKIGVYETIAAAWSTATKRYSMTEWGESRDIVVLGNNEKARTSLDPINRAIFQRATETILDLPEVDPEDKRDGIGLTWFFLDEFREAEKLEGLRRLLNKGRSPGACVVLGCQDTEGARSVYGREEADEMFGQCSHKAILRLNSHTTADWAINLFGIEDVLVETSGESVGSHFSGNTSRKYERKTLLTTGDFLKMKKISPQTGLSGYYKSPIIDHSDVLRDHPYLIRIAPWRNAPEGAYSWTIAIEPFLPPRGTSTKQKRAPQDFRLSEWTANERTKLFGREKPPGGGTVAPFQPYRP